MRVNLVTTYGCNRNCSYCITKSYNEKIPNEMSLHDLDLAVNWIVKLKVKIISLAGGEPTFYSGFDELIQRFKSHNIKFSLLTNALFSKETLELLDGSVLHECCINVDPKENYSKDQYTLLENNIKGLANRIKHSHISYNIHKANTNYTYYLELCKKFGINRIRFSVTAPNKLKNNRFVSIGEIKSFVPLVMQFVKDAKKLGLELILDFPMPYCIFNNKERNYLKRNAGLHGMCSSGIDYITINPDLTTFACAPLMIKGPKIDSFESVSRINMYFGEQTECLRWNKLLLERCKSCHYKIRRECQGGCLCYKE